MIKLESDNGRPRWKIVLTEFGIFGGLGLILGLLIGWAAVELPDPFGVLFLLLVVLVAFGGAVYLIAGGPLPGEGH